MIMPSVQCYNFSVQEEVHVSVGRFKRFILWCLGLKPDQTFGYKAYYTICCRVESHLVKNSHLYSAAFTNKYGENQHWDILKLDGQLLKLRSKKPIRFCGVGSDNYDLGRINIYVDRVSSCV